jgi:DNA-binding transcriptional LysR family regulator
MLKGRVNHRQLEAFQAIVESGTVTAAAERLYITQPAVSRLIRDLEHSLGFDLFERRAGRLLPTVEAQILHDEVQRSFMGLDRIVQTAKDIQAMNVGSLRIAAMPALALGFLPRVIGKFSAVHPNLKISLQVRSSTKVMEWLASQQLDIGFAAVQQTHAAVEQELLLEVPFVAVLPAGHPLERKSELRPADFAGEGFISQGEEMGVRSRIDAIFADAGVERRVLIDTQLSLAICNMVAEGIGLSLVEPITAAAFLDRGVIVRPFLPRLPFRFSLLVPAYRSRSNITRAFVDMVKAELARNPLIDSASAN